MKIINLLIFVCFLVTTSFASASALIGVREVGILIEELDKDAAECNITEDLLDASVRIPLSNSRLRIVKMGSVPDSYIYVHTIVLDDKEFCVVSIEVSFMKYISSERDTGEFWARSQVMSLRKLNVSTRVSGNVELMTKQFISAWLKENQN